jgi:hypothetical protein
MKKYLVSILAAGLTVLAADVAFCEKPHPFGLIVGRTTYAEAIDELKSRKWQFQEYEKKHFKEVAPDNPDRGKNSFVAVAIKDLRGLRGIRLFFNSESVLDAVIVILEPAMFEAVMDELNQKYDLVKKNLLGEDFSENYTYVLWQKGNIYVELQSLSAHQVRLLYVDKLLYENYKDFLFKPYQSFRLQQAKPEWMKDL